jgi:hypothetical protein
MTKIKVFSPSTRKGILLDQQQVAMVEAELARVLPNMEPIAGHLSRVAPDYEMSIIPDSQPIKKYEVFGRSVLVDTNAKTMTQFYMGILIMEWLYR